MIHHSYHPPAAATSIKCSIKSSTLNHPLIKHHQLTNHKASTLTQPNHQSSHSSPHLKPSPQLINSSNHQNSSKLESSPHQITTQPNLPQLTKSNYPNSPNHHQIITNPTPTHSTPPLPLQASHSRCDSAPVACPMAAASAAPRPQPRAECGPVAAAAAFSGGPGGAG